MNVGMFGMFVAAIGGLVVLFPVVGASINDAPILPFGYVVMGIGVLIGLVGLAVAGSAK